MMDSGTARVLRRFLKPEAEVVSEIEVAVQLPLTIAKTASESLQNQISNQLRALIVDGHLRPGTRLSSIRDMATQLDVSLNTAKLAYQRLISEGYLVASTANGTFVAPSLPDERMYSVRVLGPETRAERHATRFAPRFPGRGAIIDRTPLADGTIDFWAGLTDPRSFPVKEWRHMVNTHLQDASADLSDYGNAAGLESLRCAIAEHLSRARGFRPDPQQVVVTAGIQEALCVASVLFVQPGTIAVSESPGYKGATAAFIGFGARVIGVGVDDDGLMVDQLPSERAALAYVTPSHQHPTGHVLPLSRRHALLDWASHNGAFILEDDYDSDFCFENSPLPALAAIDPYGCVIYLGTFSKTMGAGLRLGYMVLPPELVDAATHVKAMFSFGQPWLEQAVMADYINSGAYALRLRRLRRDRQARLDCLLQALRHFFGEVILGGVSGGMHVVWHLPADIPSSTALRQAALGVGVRIYSPEAGGADITDCKGLNERLLVFGYAALTPEEIWEGVRRLASLQLVPRPRVAK